MKFDKTVNLIKSDQFARDYSRQPSIRTCLCEPAIIATSGVNFYRSEVTAEREWFNWTIQQSSSGEPMSSLPLTPLHETIHKRTAKDMIRDKIISMIASGILQLGDELPSERELSTMLAVSRETVRGAIQLLAGEGVVQVSQGARTRVSRIDVTVHTQRIGVTNPTSINGYSLEAVHAARLLIETAVAADAARNLRADDIRRLEDSIAAQEQAFNDPVRFLICDREFHLTIYYASTNRLLADFVVDLYTYMLDHRRIAMGQPGAIEKSLEDHRFIVRALKMRNPEAVAAAFSEHILRIHDTSRSVDASASPMPAQTLQRRRHSTPPAENKERPT